MRAQCAVFLIACCSASLCGCLARQVQQDGNGIRQALLDLYTDQAMDNLIRAYENRPFVQLAYSQLSVNDQDKAVAGAATGEVDFSGTRTTDLTKSALAQRFVRSPGLAGKFSLAGSGEQDRTLSFHADPVTDQNYIYEAYLAFARNPTLFICSDTKPECPVHIARQCGKKWYWIPVESGSAFLQLVLSTSVAPPAVPALGYWETKIDSIAPRAGAPFPVKTPFGDLYKYEVTLHDEVPADRGMMLVILKGGCKKWLPVLPVPAPEAGSKIKKVYIQFEQPLDELKGATVRFFSENFPNPAPPPSANQKTLDAIENIRILLSKSTVTSP